MKNKLLCISVFLVFLISCSSLPSKGEQELVTQNRLVAKQLIEQGNVQYDTGLFDTALPTFQSSLYLYSGINHLPGIVQSLLSISRTQLSLANETAALIALQHAEDFAQKEGDYILRRSVWNGFADYYLKIGDFDLAEEYCLMELDGPLDSEMDIHSERLRIWGTIEKKKGNLSQALAHFQQALEMDLSLGSYADSASDYYLIGSIYSLQQDYQTALAYLNLALERDSFIEFIPGVASDFHAIAKVSLKSGDNESALYYLKKSYWAWKSIGNQLEMTGIVSAIEELTGEPWVTP